MSPGAILAEAKTSGMTVTQYREELRRQVLQAKLGGLRLQGRIQIDETDLRNAYERLVREERMQLPQRTVRLAIPAGSTPQQEAEAKKLADSLSERARNGEDFQALVQRYGQGPSSGLAAPRPPLQEPPEIQRASLSLKVGETSRPIHLGDELVIVHILERDPSSLPSYEEAMMPLQERVYMEKMTEARRRWLDGLRRRTHVEIRM
jgi:peptidyl-prolyl cis-trans isomerase SurA